MEFICLKNISIKINLIRQNPYHFSNFTPTDKSSCYSNYSRQLKYFNPLVSIHKIDFMHPHTIKSGDLKQLENSNPKQSVDPFFSSMQSLNGRNFQVLESIFGGMDTCTSTLYMEQGG